MLLGIAGIVVFVVAYVAIAIWSPASAVREIRVVGVERLSEAAGTDLIAHGTESDADTIRDTAVAQPLIVAAGILVWDPNPVGFFSAGAGYSAMIPVLVFCLNLVTAFKAWGSDPVLLHYTYRILAIVFAVLASYSYAGASFNYTRPGLGIFSSTVGIYLAAICLVDDLPWADRIFFAFCIVYMVMVAVTQIRYLQRAKEEIEKELMID